MHGTVDALLNIQNIQVSTSKTNFMMYSPRLIDGVLNLPKKVLLKTNPWQKQTLRASSDFGIYLLINRCKQR